MKRIFQLAYFVMLTGLVLTILANAWVILSTREQVYYSLDELPESDVVIVLGTSKRTIKGDPNPYFAKRMEAAVALYKKGGVTQFVVSGHNPSQYYNEPRDMKAVLMEAGIPEHAIQEDTAGSRTYESILSIQELHPEKSITIITQKFHGYRALFIANHLNVNAIAFAAHNTSVSRSFDVLLREYFARIKAVGEVYLRPQNQKAKVD